MIGLLCRRMNLSPLGIVGDVLLVIGFGLGIAGLALVSTALALCVAGLILLAAGALLTALDARSGKGRTDRGPFEPGTAGKPQ